jgi:hypothetical protein
MSIWTQLEQDAKAERDLLNRAMVILGRVVQFVPDIEQRDIRLLTQHYTNRVRYDVKHSPGCIMVDVNRVRVTDLH